MRNRLLSLLSAVLLLGLLLPAFAQNEEFYWISHGDPADPVWTYFLQGAEMWADDTGKSVNTSFHSGDVPSHQEAFRAAIASGAAGIVTSTPDPGTLDEVSVSVEVRPNEFSDEMSQMHALRDRIDREIQAITGLRMKVNLVKPQSLERFAGKARRVIDHRREQGKL